jgi:hypothetical protein
MSSGRTRVGLPPNQPDIDRILVALNNSGIQQTNNALWQAIFGLLNKVRQFQGITNADLEQLNVAIDTLNNIINNISVTGDTENKAVMPFFSDEIPDQESLFMIPGPRGMDGRDGKLAIMLNDCCDEPADDFPIPFYQHHVGVNGSFTTTDGKTVTVQNGIITAIV